MVRPLDILALLLVVLAIFCYLIPLVLNRRRPRWPSVSTVLSAALLLTAAGGWLLPGQAPFWITLVAATLLIGLIVGLLLTGQWWPALFWSILGIGVAGFGGMTLSVGADRLADLGVSFFTVEVAYPLWLVLLVLIPVICVMARRNLGFITLPERRLFWFRVLPCLLLGPSLYVGVLAPVTRWSAAVWSLTDPRNVPRGHYLIFTGCLVLLSILWFTVCLAVWRKFVGPSVPDQSWRPYIAQALRCTGLAFLAVALAEPRLLQTNNNITVLFVLDRSLSVPEELVDDPAQPGARVDRRSQRILSFINKAVEERGSGRERDRAGLIVFGRRPQLELPPADAPRFNLRELPPAPDGNYTDIAAALKLALASFPEGTGKRIVLISDGNENLGNAEEQARLAQTLGVQIDVVPLASGQRNEDEVLVERVEAPPLTEQGANVPIRVLIRSFNPDIVLSRLILRQVTEKEREVRVPRGPDGGLGAKVEPIAGQRGGRITSIEPGSPLKTRGFQVGDEILKIDAIDLAGPDQIKRALAPKNPGQPAELVVRGEPIKEVGNALVRLRQGLNAYSFARVLTDEQRSYTYEAEIQPLQIEDEEKNVLFAGRPPGDRVQNNRASTHVVARGRRRILLLENRRPEKEDEVINTQLVDKLRAAGDHKFRVDVRSVNILNNYPDRDKLAVYLSDYDCVILVNIPAEKVSELQQEALRSNTQDQGCGLVMIGGPEGYGAGGWQNTAIEKALPVDSEIKSLQVQGKGGLVLIMHASEMAEGNFWQKKIAKLAIERLGAGDMVGVIDYAFKHQWHIRFQEIGGNRASLLAQVDKMMPGDMPDFDPALVMAHKELTNARHELTTKHVIVISDGDPQHNPVILAPFRRDKVTVTTVGVACHGPNEDRQMERIAKATGGRPYSVRDPNQLPAIYIKESRLVSQSFVEEKRFHPIITFRSGPTERLPDPPDLTGFVRTTAKASPLVEVPIVTPKFADMEFPLLAYWHYGLGKAVAFTSDAGDPRFWSRAWLEGAEDKQGIYAKFWEQVIEWSLRPTESNRLQMTTEYRDGKIRIVVEARTDANQPDTGLQLRGGVSTPGSAVNGRRFLQFVQKNSGQYEAEIKVEDAGSYFLTAQATRQVKVKGKDGKERQVEEGVDSVRTGITLPYSPEFAEMESNTTLLEKISSMTGGQVYVDNDRSLAEAARGGAAFRGGLPRDKSLLPLWHWLVLLAALLLLLDIAVRRIALDPNDVKTAMSRVWARLRGHEVPEPARAQFLERLQNRKATVNVHLASRRYEGTAGTAPPPLADAVALPPRPPASDPLGPRPGDAKIGADEQSSEDVLERLRQAKKKAIEDRP